MSLKEKINIEKLPTHIAIIMDGNGRWAKQQGHQRVFGHENGVNTVRQVTEAAAELGVKYLTLYAFSKENWNRPQNEVEALMNILVYSLHKELDTLMKNQIRLSAIGDLDSLPTNTLAELQKVMSATDTNTGLNLILALSYSSRWEILNATKNIASDVESGVISAMDIDDKMFEKYLTTRNIPDPELLIRTSGEYRISNFLLWQLAYTELYFTDVLWPDFTAESLYNAIIDYQQRERRFGKTSDQLNENHNVF